MYEPASSRLRFVEIFHVEAGSYVFVHGSVEISLEKANSYDFRSTWMQYVQTGIINEIYTNRWIKNMQTGFNMRDLSLTSLQIG